MQYQEQSSPQTLREGLAEYYATYPSLDRFEPDDARIIAQTFQGHDVVHVLTGMDISPMSEVILDTWQFWATYPGQDFWDSLRQTRIIFSDPEFSSRLQDIILLSEPKDWLKWAVVGFVPACKAIANALRMHKKWRYYSFSQYLDRPLVEIRDEYNLKVMSALS